MRQKPADFNWTRRSRKARAEGSTIAYRRFQARAGLPVGEIGLEHLDFNFSAGGFHPYAFRGGADIHQHGYRGSYFEPFG